MVLQNGESGRGVQLVVIQGQHLLPSLFDLIEHILLQLLGGFDLVPVQVFYVLLMLSFLSREFLLETIQPILDVVFVVSEFFQTCQLVIQFLYLEHCDIELADVFLVDLLYTPIVGLLIDLDLRLQYSHLGLGLDLESSHFFHFLLEVADHAFIESLERFEFSANLLVFFLEKRFFGLAE